MEQQGRRCGTEQEARGRLSAWRLFRLYWIELIKLNVLFLLLCLPVVTIPAAIAAMNRIVLDMLYRKPFDYRMWRGMMTTFRRDFGVLRRQESYLVQRWPCVGTAPIPWGGGASRPTSSPLRPAW